MPELVYSPGLEGVVAGETAVSTITGGLEYRGYAVEELAEHAHFPEVAYLLLVGELPNKEQLRAFERRLLEQSALPAPLIDTLRAIPPRASMMDVMRTAASMLAHWDEEVADNSHAANVRKAERLIARLPVALAARHRLRQGREPILPDPARSLAGNLLWMLEGAPPPANWERAMDVSLILYAEHEFNASTFAARVVVSTLADLHSGVTAAIGALKGPLHGGANERVLEIIEQIESPAQAEAWVRDALAKKQRIMGFGHRVYKEGDPRARYLKQWCQRLAAETGHQTMEAVGDAIERVVRQEKKLPPNLDWPSARLYHYMRLPVDLYTPLFVVARVTGWCAHIIEQLDNNRLIRPRANYTGPASRPLKPIDAR